MDPFPENGPGYRWQTRCSGLLYASQGLFDTPWLGFIAWMAIVILCLSWFTS